MTGDHATCERCGTTRPAAELNNEARIRVTPDERARWQAAAERAGKTLSEWIRERCG